MKLSPIPIFLFISVCASAQTADKISFTENKYVKSIYLDGKEWTFEEEQPLFSYEADNVVHFSSVPFEKLSIDIGSADIVQSDLHVPVVLKNISRDTIVLKNIVPFSVKNSNAFITGKGDHELSRTHLFLPGKLPVNVIVPDNAWELGYNSIMPARGIRLSALSRRDRKDLKQGQLRRFETILYPGGSVRYNFYFTGFDGPWQNGLIKTFQQRKLYDIAAFNDSLFQRKDLQWIRHSYVMHLMFAWDKYYYDYTKNKYTLEDFLKKGKTLYGGDDVVAIWPTWPTLGLDPRNQFDLFYDLPGGITAMKKMAETSRKNGVKFFLCYNPWDESTRKENHFEGLSKLIGETSADGVVLDTRGSSSRELQDAADKVRKGVIMYSEGMAVPKDMQGIVSGRVHNALTHPPMLNLNKLIKPEFAIFRVSEINKGKITRDFATSFFNGYGTEINIMSPGEPDDLEGEYHFLGRTARILRENTFNFTSSNYTPLIACSADSIWVNKWDNSAKTIYTVFSLKPEGYKGNLFSVIPDAASHYVDLWRHKMLEPVAVNGTFWIEVETDAFNTSYLGTDNEGAVDCVARLPKLLTAKLYGDQLILSTKNKEGEIWVWKGAPDYSKRAIRLKPSTHQLSVHDSLGRFEGDIVIQQLANGVLLDETIVSVTAGMPRRISTGMPARSLQNKTGMIQVPAGEFLFKTTHGDDFIGYPTIDEDSTFRMPSFLIDKNPVTNMQFRKFLDATKYKPADPANFLKHWVNGTYPKGQGDSSVVYVSYEDAKAYAAWAGRRLPTEIEWQYAAVTAGAKNLDLRNLYGNVWQLTNDLYETASHRYIILKGGSWFNPTSSNWYVQGGPKDAAYRQFLLRVSNGFERNATVGFRCVADQ